MRPEKLPFIVGLGGTTRPGSSTELALRFTLKVAGELGAETKMFGGHDLLMPIYDPYMAERTENAAGLIEALRRCDGVVIASPGYHGSVSGLVKNALDYTEDMRNDLEPYFEGRSVGCIACALGSQATGTTLVTLRSIVHALRGWPTPFGVGINTAKPIFQPDGTVSEPEAEKQLRILAGQVVNFANAMRGTAAAGRGCPPVDSRLRFEVSLTGRRIAG